MMRGIDVINALKKKLRVQTDAALAKQLGMSIPSIQNWKKRSSVTARQFAELVHRSVGAGADRIQLEAIRPIVEFFRIDRSSSRLRARFEVFNTVSVGSVFEHPYRSGLKEELLGHHGIYIFFDSRGQAIYTGKARRQNLWKEMNLAFNRRRGDVQAIKRVRHPNRRVQYRNSDEKARQIVDTTVPLHEIAMYFSAYEVVDSMINDLEAMLVRSFANDLLNVRMERFARQKRGGEGGEP